VLLIKVNVGSLSPPKALVERGALSKTTQWQFSPAHDLGASSPSWRNTRRASPLRTCCGPSSLPVQEERRQTRRWLYAMAAAGQLSITPTQRQRGGGGRSPT
jgi:hypothetical protein